MLGNKASVNKFRKTEIISCIFSDHNAMKLKINQKKKAGKMTNMWGLNNMLLNNQWITPEISAEIKKYLETNENEIIPYQLIWDAAKAILRGNSSQYMLTLTNKTISNLKLHLIELEK